MATSLTGTPCPTITSSLDKIISERKKQGLEISVWQESALKDLKISGLPSTDNEHWKYTSNKEFISNFENHGLLVDKSNHEIDITLLKTPRLLFINGKLNVEASRLNKSFEMSKFTTTNFRESSEFIPFFNAFDEINLIGTEEVIEVKVKESSKEELYIYYYYFSDAKTNFASSKLKVHLEDSAHLILREEHLYKNENALTHANTIQEFQLDNSAKLEHIVLDTCALKNSIFSYMKRKAMLNKKAELNLHFFHLAHKFKREEILYMLNDKEASCNIYGLGLGQNKGHLDHFIRVHHLSPQTFSNQLVKNIVKDQSRCVFTGMVFIDKNCSLSESAQLNKNLLMDRLAHVDTRPQLEVLNHDVKCSHGATIGRFSDDELFYLTSRGIEPQYAIELLSKAFAGEMLQSLKYEADLKDATKAWEIYA